ncbi:anaerobic ribonucleoside-triphosphate reductase [Persicirhabdus sediminis]|uniref:Anaerobic ribonucleoside-triphosphate reductase n=1 Tax=Persicirhabdus sediminis TaxID=454144 RepID=A0A8J7MIE1_9BACT|nr:anaerobic ribonucleoside-triphosphate reductase [Persicirhabdus sediminis]MBK1792559.1 anaerobic ribonucleoside-triphosphate reductase [Persicirhabdus sediminis]
MLTDAQISQKQNFIRNYISADNAADGSQQDPNANVTQKNIATLENELFKDYFRQINRRMMYDRIGEMFDSELADEYLRQLDTHEIYAHDETSIKPYCASITLYPFLLDGLTKIGGESKAPKHLDSFCGSFINLIFAVSSQFAGALATVEFLMYFDHFAQREFGDEYLETQRELINSHLQHVVYSINQPAASRGYQSVFWNISVYDEHYFEAIFGDFVFPNGDKPNYDRLAKLQSHFLSWFNHERTRSVLTFPVVTAALLNEGNQAKDREFSALLAKEMSEGNSFFIYQSSSADSLSSCCRLRNEISDTSFSYSLGAGGVSTGSLNVITLNMNRLVQDGRDLATEIDKIHRYQVAYHSLLGDMKSQNMLPVYDAGFITMEKQFLTIGINGLIESAEFLGIAAENDASYISYLQKQLGTIYDLNRAASKKYGCKFNTELIPAESLGVRNAQWDREDGYQVQRDCYNSYFYRVEDEQLSMLDKMILHGKQVVDYLDGGSALHLNLHEQPSKESLVKLIDAAARLGTNYWCINVKCTICDDCGYIDKKTCVKCSSCGSTNIAYATRIIGYLKRIDHFSSPRQKEAAVRHYTRQPVSS